MDEDIQLIERFRNGDQRAFDELMKKYYRKVCNTIFYTIGSPEHVEDLAQDIFIKVYDSLPSYRSQSSFFTWLYRITINFCIDEIRRQRRQRFFSFGSLSKRQQDVDHAKLSQPSIDAEVDRRELISHLRRAIAMLPEKLRAVITLRDIEGLSYAEIATILKCSLGTVKSRLFTARTKMRESLKPYMEEKP